MWRQPEPGPSDVEQVLCGYQAGWERLYGENLCLDETHLAKILGIAKDIITAVYISTDQQGPLIERSGLPVERVIEALDDFFVDPDQRYYDDLGNDRRHDIETFRGNLSTFLNRPAIQRSEKTRQETA